MTDSKDLPDWGFIPVHIHSQRPLVKVWSDDNGKVWCQFPGEAPERLLTAEEIAEARGQTWR